MKPSKAHHQSLFMIPRLFCALPMAVTANSASGTGTASTRGLLEVYADIGMIQNCTQTNGDLWVEANNQQNLSFHTPNDSCRDDWDSRDSYRLVGRHNQRGNGGLADGYAAPCRLSAYGFQYLAGPRREGSVGDEPSHGSRKRQIRASAEVGFGTNLSPYQQTHATINALELWPRHKTKNQTSPKLIPNSTNPQTNKSYENIKNIA